MECKKDFISQQNIENCTCLCSQGVCMFKSFFEGSILCKMLKTIRKTSSQTSFEQDCADFR
uniref:Uncharacterized protein n=1 Tax=Rhizophora mucronata TaxID=61149 RepID=A0A2P2LWD5_RHIMU